MRRTFVILAVAILLLVAGCTALAPADDGTEETPTEPDPTPSPEGETEVDADPEEQPWIDDGELDADALAETHTEAVMDAESFTIASEIASTHEGDEPPRPWFENQTLETAWNLEHERESLDNEFLDTPERLTLYVDSERVYLREVAGDDTRYSVDDVDRTTEEFTAEMRENARTGTGALAEWQFGFDVAEQCGELTCYRFTGTDFDGDREVPETVTDGEATLVVDERGIIRELTQEFEGEMDGQAVTVAQTSAYQDVGETSLPEPGWVDEARETAGDDE